MGCSQSTIRVVLSGEWTEDESGNEVSVASEGQEMKMMLHRKKKRKWGFKAKLLGCGVELQQEEEEEDALPENDHRAWLLASAEGDGKSTAADAPDPQSMHSSFRFSFGSQAEFDALNPNATVLMLNLERNSEEKTLDFQRRRILSLERSISTVSESLLRFTYGEIRSATNDFSRGRVLGRGAHSCVYRGRLRLGRAVAIKRLNNADKECSKDFCRELMISSSLDNRFVVPLLGYCVDAEGLFLVYKFVSGGNLAHHLHGNLPSRGFDGHDLQGLTQTQMKESSGTVGSKNAGRQGRACLPWSVRFKVALGVAQAVAYLHYGTERCVVHRDIKPSNILLSSKKTPKLCDFGLATWTSGASIPFLCKTVKGTFGYLAPEYFQHGKVSNKTDVYAFGVVLLELVTGRQPIETGRSAGDENLVQWVRPLLLGEGSVTRLVDPRLKRGSYSLKQVSRVVRTAAACISSEESSRPGIDQVIRMLRGEEAAVGEEAVFTETGLYGGKGDMGNHLALAMLGVTEADDGDQNRW
ncbi:putative proline-rich receptor-like protein kinase [Nymphaea thermarum]|nr:putative proline-rich receptor-like protein kinase [Nymphaea thermarum]